MTDFLLGSLDERIEEMNSACTRCGKCVEACPIKGPAGITAPVVPVIAGIFDILHTGDGPADSRRWAATCMLSGDCIKACPEGVNPRLLLTMARLAMAKAEAAPQAQRRQGVEQFRKLNRDVTVQSRMQLDDEVLVRLGQRVSGQRSADATPDAAPDFVFYTGCNLLKTPHIALLALDIMDALQRALPSNGRPDPLLRHRPASHRRYRHLGQHGRKHDEQARPIGTRPIVVRELPRPVHRSDAARP